MAMEKITFKCDIEADNIYDKDTIDSKIAGVSSALSSRLSKTDAASTYLSKTDAASTYLSQTNATSTYLSKTAAASTYVQKNSTDIQKLQKLPAHLSLHSGIVITASYEANDYTTYELYFFADSVKHTFELTSGGHDDQFITFYDQPTSDIKSCFKPDGSFGDVSKYTLYGTGHYSKTVAGGMSESRTWKIDELLITTDASVHSIVIGANVSDVDDFLIDGVDESKAWNLSDTRVKITLAGFLNLY